MKRSFFSTVTLFAILTLTADAYNLTLSAPDAPPDVSEPTPLETPDPDIEALEARVTDAPGDHHAWRELGWAYWHFERLDLARKAWLTWRRLQPERAEVHALIARLELADNRLKEAIVSFRRSLEIASDQNDIRFELARTLRWAGHLTEAIDRLQDLHNEQPDNDEIKLELARALSSNWNYDQALPLWESLRADHPGDLDIRTGEALAMLHTGSPQTAILDAHRILRNDPEHLTALTILADEAEFSGRLQEAIPWVERLIDVTDDHDDRLFLKNRLLTLRRRTASADSHIESLRRHEALARRMVAAAPRNVDVRLALITTLTEQRKYDEAETMLLSVLREFNPRHYRTHMMLFEIALARPRIADARRYLEVIRQFNPLDPYLEWYQARLYAADYDLEAAYAALDRLAAAGERGATAVMLHHALTSSDYGPPLSAKRFREHLLALMHAGYEFLTPEEIHEHWERLGPAAGRTADGRIRRVVAITFDDALESAMRYATPIGIEYGIRFGQHIIAGFVDRVDPYLASWDDLAHYAESGVWEYGSHLYLAHDRYPIDSSGARGRPAAIRQWFPDERRYETATEYALRIEHEYRYARERISQRLGHPVRGVAYPYGDIGQEGISNMPDAVPINLQHAANQHTIGFIQTPFGHAVRGANPLLYSRHEMPIHWSGDQVVQYLIDRHPVILAERTRLQFAQWHGQPGIARQSLERLRTAGYPESALTTLTTGLTTNMASVFGMPATVTDHRGGPTRMAGIDASWFQDNFKARHLQFMAQGGLALQPDIHLTLRAGTGRLTQQGSDSEETTRDTVSLNETLTELLVSFIDDRRWIWAAGIGWRGWSGDAHGDRLQGRAEAHGRLSPELALRAAIRADTPEQALALTRGLSRTATTLEGRWDIAQAWSLSGQTTWEHWSDNNSLLRLDLQPAYAPVAWRGIFVGGRLAHFISRRDTPSVWTPRRFEGYYGMAGRRGQLAGGQYNLTLQAGAGRETEFTPAADSDNPIPEPASTSTAWDNAYGVGVGWQRPLDAGWQMDLRIDWNYNSNYTMSRMQATLLRRF